MAALGAGSPEADEDLESLAVRTLVCPRCEARPGAHCTTIAGKRTLTHTGRTDPVRLAYTRGWDDGQRANA